MSDTSDWNGPDSIPTPPGYKGGSGDFTVQRISDPQYRGETGCGSGLAGGRPAPPEED